MTNAGLNTSPEKTHIGIGIASSKKRRRKKDRANISASELKEKMAEVEANFIKPRPMKELDGELGVTLFDIAQSLGTSHAELKRSVERSGELEYLRVFGYQTMTTVIVPAAGPRSESYVINVMAAQHIVAKYDNFAGRYYLDFLIRCKDALKVSLGALQKTESNLKEAQRDLTEARKQIAALTQPRLTRRNNIILKKIIAEKGGLFHDTTYRVEKEIIKQPKKEDANYDEHYLQKLSRITNGNIKSMGSALKKLSSDRDALSKRMDQLSDIGCEVDALINPTDEEKYNELVKKIELETQSEN